VSALLENAFQGKHCLVAGGAGFLGSHLCDRLLALGARVTAVDSELTGNPANLGSARKSGSFAYLKADVTENLPAVAAPLHFAFNLASPASPVHYAKYPLETLRAGSLGTENLLRLSLEQGAVFLQASTSEVYGDPEVHPQPETYWGRVNPVGERSMYDEAKRYGEALCAAYGRSKGARVRIARIFNTYGPRMSKDDGRVIPALICQALAGASLTVFGKGAQTRSFCYVDDLVEGLLRLAASDAAGPVNLGSAFECTVLDLSRLILRLAGSKSEILFKPLPADDPRQRRPDTALAEKLLGWKAATSLEEGLKKTIPWFAAAPAGG